MESDALAVCYEPSHREAARTLLASLYGGFSQDVVETISADYDFVNRRRVHYRTAESPRYRSDDSAHVANGGT